MKTYIVVPGDNMWQIAVNHGIGLNKLLAANPQITNSSLIYPNQVINIPSSNGSTYTVGKGDTMWKLSKQYGTSLNNLMSANPQIKNPNLIYPNQIINIPTETNLPETPSTPSVPGTPSTPDNPSNIRLLEDEVIRLVNVERKKAGQPELIKNDELINVSRMKSQDFVDNNYFSHNSPVYGSPFDMLRSFGIRYSAAGENIASGQRTAAEAMNHWMNSSGHRANILNTSFNQIGVGVARDNNGNLYWTQMFIKS